MARPLQENHLPSVGKIIPPKMRYLWAGVVVLFLLLLLAAALAIPFVFESPSMWYKFGIETTSLRMGKMLGLTAGLLLLLQMPLAGRLKTLDRIAGLLITSLLVVHVLYVIESFTDQGPPRLSVFLAAGVFLMLWIDEWDDLAAKLTGLRRTPMFTRKTENGNRSGRLNRTSLGALLKGCSRGSAVFVCGPPQMMLQVKTDLKPLRFPARSIFTETFGF